MTVDNTAAALGPEAVEQLAASHGEPDWLRERRQEAFATYARTPAPSNRDEEWRRTDLRWLDWDALGPALESAIPERTPAAVPRDALAPSAVVGQADGSSGVMLVADAVRSAGITVTGLQTAAREHPDPVRNHLSTRAVTADRGKLQALNTALWSGGAFVHVPRGVRLDDPILVVVEARAPHIYPRTLVRVEEGASVSVVEWWTSGPEGAAEFANGAVELFVEAGARLDYTHVQAWGPGLGSFLSQRALVGRDASLTTSHATLGGRFHKARTDTMMEGPGSTVRMNGITCLTGRQFVDHHTLQDHIATDAESDLLYVGVLDDAARSVYAGTIAVEPHAQRSNAYQHNRNLLLSGGPRADSIPQLEIMADDVRCTHGATISTVDRNQRHYLESRGIDPEQAEGLIVDGFFEPVLDRVGHDRVRETLRGAVQAKLTAARGAVHA